MSIKNPYTELLGITADSGRLVHVANPAYPAFNEGVKAANEDWVEWLETTHKNCNLFNCPFSTATCRMMDKSCRVWEIRKKEIKQ